MLFSSGARPKLGKRKGHGVGPSVCAIIRHKSE